jgi:cytochrome P450
MTRTVIAPLEVCGVQLQPGDRVHAPPAAANRDPKYYPSPDEPRLDRGGSVKPHLTFSVGAHRCLGSHIARLEMRATIEEWHRRIPDYRIAPGEPVVEHLSTVWGIDRLVLEW